jgi:hypothetical protein
VLGDRLKVHRRGEVVIASGYRRELPHRQTGYGLREHERWIEVGIICAAAIPSPPTGVQRELHEVCQPGLPTRARRFTAGQSTKRLQVDRLGALRSQIGVEEREVRDLVVGVVMDVRAMSSSSTERAAV